MGFSAKELSAALAQDELTLHYQPLVAAHSGMVVGVEALVRWQHPRRGFLLPDVFLPALERNRLMGGLTEWVIDRALAQSAAWRAVDRHIPVAVNLSATLLGNATVPAQVRDILARHELPPHLLTLEITETALVAHASTAKAIVAELRAAGVRVSIDDFGTGYTSLDMLREYPVDEIKIDRTFVSAMLHSSADAAIVRAILELGHRLGAEVLAEGVESELAARQLAELGCDTLQGYLFARPLPADELLRFVQRTGSDRRLGANGLLPEGTPRPAVHTSGAVPAPLPADEEDRLRALLRLDVLDTDSDPVLDGLTSLAAEMCGTQTALLSFVDRDRQWFKARIGTDVQQTPRELAFCAHAILDPDQVMEIPDAAADLRFATNPLVVDEPHIRFYAGAPLLDSERHALGTLCVLDPAPRTLSDRQRGALQKLSAIATSYLQARHAEQVMHRLRDVQAALSQMSSEEDTPETASLVVTAARDLLKADGTLLVRPEARGSVLYRPVAMSLGRPEWAPATARLVLDSRKESGTALSATIRTRKSVFVARVDNDGPQVSSDVVELDAATTLHLPILTDIGVTAVLIVWWTTPQPPLDPTAESTATMLAAELGNTLMRINATAALRTAADTDPLTGLLNRRAFVDALHHIEPDTALVMIDLDHFKDINDAGGHRAGDQALKAFSAQLRAAARNGDHVCRWGGEEFAVALPAAGCEGAEAFLRRLRESWATNAPATFSSGYAIVEPSETPLSALDRADHAVYRAKAAGRDRDLFAASGPTLER